MPASFTFLGVFGKPCAGLPPAGRIVKQKPPAGASLEPGEAVKVQTSCGPAAADPPCDVKDLSLEAIGNNDFTGASDYVGVEVLHRRGRPCILHATLEAQVQSQLGLPLQPIEGNPATLEISERLGVGETLYGGWAWLDWCESREHVQVVMKIAGLEARDGAPAASCQTDGERQSRLTFAKRGERLDSEVSAHNYAAAPKEARPAWRSAISQ